MLQVGEEPFSVQDIYNQFKGKSLKQDMEIVSELLGHTKLATAQQSYRKIVQKKVADEMARIRED